MKWARIFGTEWALMSTTAHPIDPRVYTGLNQTLSATQYAALLALCVREPVPRGLRGGGQRGPPGTLASVAP